MTSHEAKALYGKASSKRNATSLFRVAGALGACGFVGLAAIAVGGWFAVVGLLVASVVAFAFVRESRKDLGGALVLVVGQVTESGWVQRGDSGGISDTAARLVMVPRVSLEVEECFEFDAANVRKDRDDLQRPFVVEQPKWLKRVSKGQRVVFVCLPSSTEPVEVFPA